MWVLVDYQVEGRVVVDAVGHQSAVVLELLTSKDKALGLRRVAFLVLDFDFDLLDGIVRIHLEGQFFSFTDDVDLHDLCTKLPTLSL